MKLLVEPGDALLTVLREQPQINRAKYGCGEGACGACTVLINGAATRSCITPVSSVAGKEVTTIEGLEKNGKLHARAGSLPDNRCFSMFLLCIGHDHVDSRTPEK